MVVVIGGVVGAAALASLWVGSRDPESAPATAPAPPVRDASAPAPPLPDPPVARPASRPASPVSAPATPAAAPAPALPETPTTATLHITSDVPDAQVFIDRKFIGMAPVTADEVAPGSHQINISAPGYDGVAETVDVTPGPRDIAISLKAIRLDESIAVKHKHRLGSCSGQLSASPEGLRYETDNANDSFQVPLTGIETFTMDFMAKNLKVKIRGGRSYDFTDPDDKAEPLYFFHQAVEKVRERLAKGSGRDPAQERR